MTEGEGRGQEQLTAARACWEADEAERLAAAKKTWQAEEGQRLATVQETWQAEAQARLAKVRQTWESEAADRLARVEAEWAARLAAAEARPESSAPEPAAAVGQHSPAQDIWMEPDPGAIAREAIEEAKRETEEAKRALEERRHQAKLEGRRVADRRHRRTALGVIQAARGFEIKRPQRKLAAAGVGLLLLAAAAFTAPRDLSTLEAGLAAFDPSVAEPEPATVFVRSGVVNLRAEATTTARVIGRVVRDTVLPEIGRRGEWVQVVVPDSGGKHGWIHASLVTSKASGRPAP